MRKISFGGLWLGPNMGHWIPSMHNGTYGIGLWRFIITGWDRFLLSFVIVFEVGGCSSIFFWHSRWRDIVCLRDRFPSLSALAAGRDALLSLII